MHIHLNIIGIVLVTLSFVHIKFPLYFNWKEELSKLSLMNKQMMQIHTFYIALTVFLIGILSVFFKDELINTNFGNKICFGLFVFWFLRLIFQLFVYSTELWKGKLFETVIHFLFTCFWAYMSIIYFLIWYR